MSQPLGVPEVLRWLERRGTKRNRDGMARYGIRSARAFGVSGETMRPLAKRLGRDHGLAARLWDAGWHETRILASLVDEPARVTPAQMDRWARAFDNWAVCDSVCFHLFDRTPHAWTKASSGADATTSSSSARRLRCWRDWPCTTSSRPTHRFSRACRSSSGRRATIGTSSRKP